MLPGTWCGGMGVLGWLVLILFWATVLGLAVWAVTGVFPPSGSRDLADAGTTDQDRRGP